MNVMARKRMNGGRPSLGEQPVDVVVRDLREGRFELDMEALFFVFDFGRDVFENLVELRGRAPNPQADETERGPFVENDDENHPLGDDRDVDVVLLALVEED